MKFLILCSLFIFSLNSYAKNSEVFDDQEYVQIGDMFVPTSALLDENSPVDHRAVKDSSVRLWTGGILWYQFSPNVSASRRNLFLSACQSVGEFADIRCLPRRSQDRNYIYVQDTNENLCGSSFLGMRGGRQALKINCWRQRTLQHEIMHALGISHEHNRHDRDQHLTIVWNNIHPSNRYNFRKLARPSHALNYYDYDSVMHYDSYSGSQNGGIVFYRRDLGPTQGRIYQADEMSYGDHYMLYHLYGGRRP
jgi:hypothetical protein